MFTHLLPRPQLKKTFYAVRGNIRAVHESHQTRNALVQPWNRGDDRHAILITKIPTACEANFVSLKSGAEFSPQLFVETNSVHRHMSRQKGLLVGPLHPFSCFIKVQFITPIKFPWMHSIYAGGVKHSYIKASCAFDPLEHPVSYPFHILI